MAQEPYTLRAILCRPVSPSVVVLDIGMPRIDGLEVLRRLRADERTELLPVVVLSANDGISDVSRAYR